MKTKDPNKYKAPVDFNPFLALLEKLDKALMDRVTANMKGKPNVNMA